ncbi:tryptophan 2,3-dioxygenase family protein [Bdellovibrio sp. HCB337]|uniref:tryptophan 2,3-dioxygenase family protein n=1 Tax=Bdellovibrio sp. HCB337 TaxID=3394358 RepID=UPI0039A686D1
MKHPPIHYHDYLKIDQLLSAQKRRSEELGNPAHDELLFITVHQAYELWFKQIIFEIDSVLEIFSAHPIAEKNMALASARIDRVISILKLIMGQIDVMETMTPLDFLEFRDYLYPASGFQSVQFRLIETKLGLKEKERLLYNQTPFYQHLPEPQQKLVKEVMSKESLFELIDKWLARTPFLQNKEFDFWGLYKTAVTQMFEGDRQTVKMNPQLPEEVKKKNLEMIDASEKTFHATFSEEDYKKLQEQGHFHLSFKAFHGALLIYLYRDQPIFHVPFKILSSLMDIDELLTQWRYRHALMAHRMLGQKIGTGGSSGHTYLKAATDKHKVFTDFFNLSTFLIPRSKVPPLPESLQSKMNFNY